MALPAIFVEIGAKTEAFQKAMGDVSKRLNAIDRDAQKAFSGFDKIGERLTSIGTGLTAAISLPLAGAGVAATKFATDFDSEMRKVTSLISGVTQKDFENLSRQTLQLSRDLGVDAVNATKGLYEAISAGVPKENAISFLADASKSAIAGATQTGVAVDVLTTFMAAYGDKAKDTRKLSDALFQAVNVGKFQFEDLAKSIGPAAQQASNLGVSYEELLAATSTLSLSSGGVSQAVTQIESAMRALLAPTKEMQAAFSKIGVESGTAAIQAFGFEGTLQKLRETTGDSAEAFNALFGRIEGATGALGLTGDNAKKAAADYATLKTASDGLGATQKALDERNKSTARQFEILTNSLKTTAIELGVQLLPAVNGLLQASKPLVDLLGLMVKGFSALPAPLQAVVLGLVGIAAAAGPVVLVAGQMLTAYASLQAALIAVNGAAAVSATTALPGLSTAMGAATFATEALSVALRAIPFVALAAGVALVLDKLAQTKTAQENLANASKQQAETIEYLNKKYREQQVSLGNVAATSTSAKEKLLDFVQTMKSATSGGSTAKAFDADRNAIEKFKQEIIASEKQTKLHNAALIELGLGHKIAGQGANALQDAVKKTETAYKAAVKAYDDGKISLTQLGAAQEAFIRAQDAADPERVAKRHEAAYFSMLDRYDEMAKGIIKLSHEVREAEKAVADSALKNAIDFGKAHDDMIASAQKMVAITVPLNERIPASVQAAIKANKDLALSYEIVGTKSPAELQKLVTETQRAYAEIVKATGKASTQSLEAWIKMRQAEIDLARRSGQVVPDEQLKALERAQQQLDAALGKQTTSQKRWAQQVSTIINDLAKDIARATVNLFKGLFDFDGFNKKLREDSDKLRSELAEREAALDEFRQSTEAKIAGTESKYADQLASETATLRGELAERTSEFEQYTETVAQKLEELRGTESVRLANELDELATKLREKEGAYEEYVAEVAGKEEEIRTSHAERLAEQLGDLRDNLRDRAQAYSDYVEDANTSLARIGSDLNETISDATAASNRKIEDENRDFARDSEKLNEDLRKAEKKGDKEAVTQIKRNLAQRIEDHQRATKRIQEDLAEQIDDARKRSAEQTADLQKNLERRTRDHQEYIDENIKAQRKATEDHAKQQAQQLKDLQDALDKRTNELLAFRQQTATAANEAQAASSARYAKESAELAASLETRRKALEAFETETQRKIDERTEYYKTKQSEEVAALQADFASKLTEYDKYRKGVEQKLQELVDAHKGPLDRLKEMFTSVFSSASEAILRLASEEVIGALFKRLNDLITDTFPSLAGKIKDMLGLADSAKDAAGKATDAAGKVPSVPGGGGGGGGAASGLGGTIDTITGAISAAADVVSAIYNIRIEGTLNQIERNTAAASIHLRHTLENSNQWWPFLRSIYTATTDLVVPTLRELRDGLKTLFSVNVNLTDEEQKKLVNSLITRVGTFDTVATDRLLDIHHRVGDVVSAVQDARTSLTKEMAGSTQLLIGGLAAIEKKLPSTASSILGGIAGIGGVAGAVGSAVGSLLAGLISGRASGKTEDLIEENTRFGAIGIIGEGGVIANQHAAYKHFKSIDEFMIQKMGPSLNSIISWTEENPIASRIQSVYDLISDKTNGYLERIAGVGVTMATGGGMSLTVNAPIYLDSRLIGNAIAEKNELSGGGI